MYSRAVDTGEGVAMARPDVAGRIEVTVEVAGGGIGVGVGGSGGGTAVEVTDPTKNESANPEPNAFCNALF